jgi:NADPH:quinone reductase-like Zn-dependent oxidoreductase
VRADRGRTRHAEGVVSVVAPGWDGPHVDDTMRAIRLEAPGGPEMLAIRDVDVPRPQPGDVLVRVHAAAITRDELDWPVDRLPATPSYEVSGVVAAVTPGVTDVEPGVDVYALMGFDRDGAAAGYAVVRDLELAAKPRTLAHVEAAAFPMPALTAWQAMFDHGGLTEGGRVLIHGATGGVGHMATQLARWRGAHVIATVSGAKSKHASGFGADEVIDRSMERFEDVIEPVDLVLDTVGGAALARSAGVLRPHGRLVTIAEEPPATVRAQVDTVYFVVEGSGAQLAELTALVEAGSLRPAIDSVFPFDDARAAFERSMAPDTRGKVVMQVVDG